MPVSLRGSSASSSTADAASASLDTIKAMGAESRMQRRWEEQLAGYVGASFRASNLGNIASQSAGFINKVTVVLILWIGAMLVMTGKLSVGQLIAFNMIALKQLSPAVMNAPSNSRNGMSGCSTACFSD